MDMIFYFAKIFPHSIAHGVKKQQKQTDCLINLRFRLREDKQTWDDNALPKYQSWANRAKYETSLTLIRLQID